MSGTRRKFTVEEKLRVLGEADQNGVEVTLRKYQLARSLFYKWKGSFDKSGTDGLAKKYHRIDPVVRELELENERLRRIIAKQALYIEIKDELLKKNDQRSK